MDSPVFLVFIAVWICSYGCGAALTVREDRLTLAMGMYAIAIACGLCAMFMALNLHQWVASNGEQVAAGARRTGGIVLILTGMAAMAVAILSNTTRRTRIALAAYSLAMLAFTPLIQRL